MRENISNIIKNIHTAFKACFDVIRFLMIIKCNNLHTSINCIKYIMFSCSNVKLSVCVMIYLICPTNDKKAFCFNIWDKRLQRVRLRLPVQYMLKIRHEEPRHIDLDGRCKCKQIHFHFCTCEGQEVTCLRLNCFSNNVDLQVEVTIKHRISDDYWSPASIA